MANNIRCDVHWRGVYHICGFLNHVGIVGAVKLGAMLGTLRRGLLYAVIFIAVIYAADYLAARTYPLGSVQVQPYYAVHLKSKRTEFDFDVPVEHKSCVQSLAPHLGYPPCWYLQRRTSEVIE
jgi:hypothetical protein